jgi:hypothetical protein
MLPTKSIFLIIVCAYPVGVVIFLLVRRIAKKLKKAGGATLHSSLPHMDKRFVEEQAEQRAKTKKTKKFTIQRWFPDFGNEEKDTPTHPLPPA